MNRKVVDRAGWSMLSLATMMADIAITGVDESMTQGVPGSALKEIYLKLSATPPQEWAAFFNAERAFARHSMWRKARLWGSHIIVTCPLAELQRHLDDLKQDVQTSNAKYRDWFAQHKQKQAAEAEADAAERNEIAEALGKLKF